MSSTENRSNNTEMVSVPFQREDRYIVIKRSDLAKVPVAYRSALVDPLFHLQAHLPQRECLVVESDWPEYEPTWAAIKARVTGQPAEQKQGEPVALPEVLSLEDPRCPRNPLIADGFRCGADWMRREVAKLGPLYTHADPGEVERLRNEHTEAVNVGMRYRDQCKALRAQLTELEALHGGDLGLPKEGWPAYHKRKMETMRDLKIARYESQLAERDALLRESSELLACPQHHVRKEYIALYQRIDSALSASAEPSAAVTEVNQALLADLTVAAETLRRYESLHRAKGTAESTAKAEVNAELATRFEDTISKAAGAGSPMRAPLPVVWEDAERIANLPQVHEALKMFSEDPTGDAGTSVVREVLEVCAERKQP